MQWIINLGQVQESPALYGPLLHSRDIFKAVSPLFREIGREVFLVLYLNTKNELIQREMHSVGSSQHCLVYIRELCRAALLCPGCVGVVIAHNHLTESSEPSAEDRDISARLKAALALFDITLLDHLILPRAGKGYYSFTDRGQL